MKPSSKAERPEIDWDGLIRFIHSLRRRDEWERERQVSRDEQAKRQDSPAKRPEPDKAAFPQAKLLTLTQVSQIVGLSKAALWRMRNEGAFPQPIHLRPGNRQSIRWHSDTILAWINERQ